MSCQNDSKFIPKSSQNYPLGSSKYGLEDSGKAILEPADRLMTMLMFPMMLISFEKCYNLNAIISFLILELGNIFFISGKSLLFTNLSNSAFKKIASSFTTGLVSHFT